jgi:hypothetical protein
VVNGGRRVVRGTEATHHGPGITTPDSERLNTTLRASLAPLGRRGRALAHSEAVLTAGMWRFGWASNCCWLHQSLRVASPAGVPWKRQEPTPAMAVGPTDHLWTRLELVDDYMPLPAWVVPKRRGRPPQRALQRLWQRQRDHA